MAADRPIGVVADELRDAILATPKHQRRLLSRTFWQKFGYKARTKERIGAVKQALAPRQIIIVEPVAEVFGMEGPETWVRLAYYPESQPGVVDSQTGTTSPPRAPRPPDSWFETMQKRRFETEREVETYFVAPLLEALGYVEADIIMGLVVDQYEGTKKHQTEADVVVFNGSSRAKDDGLFVIEAKRPGRSLDADAQGQARSYALWLTVPYYVVTSGVETIVYAFRGGIAQDLPLLAAKQAELAAKWDDLAARLSRHAVIAQKARLAEGWPPPAVGT